MRWGRMHPRVLADVIKNLFSKSWKGHSDWGGFWHLEKGKHHMHLKDGNKEEVGKWQAILAPGLGWLWSIPSLKQGPATGRTGGSLGSASTDLPGANHIWQTWLCSAIRRQEKSNGCWFRKDFGKVSHDILIATLVTYEPDGLHKRWVDDCLNC